MSLLTETAPDQPQAPVLDELKQRHRAMWASGDYPAVVREVVAPLGPVLVHAARVRRGDHVLDVAAGSGNASIPAAARGAVVVASDLTPELFDAGRLEATRRGVDLVWEQADAEALPYPDEQFDTTLSCLGVMFAPHHEAAASELVRVTRKGGRIGLLSWTPQGFIGRMFATMKPFLPAPPPGAQPPPLWGDPEHVARLLGDSVTEVGWTRQTLRVGRFGSPQEFREFFKAAYGPTIAAYRNLAGRPERIADLDVALSDLAREHMDHQGVMQWEYLLLTARRA